MSLSSFTYYSSEYTIYGSAIVDSFTKIRPVISLKDGGKFTSGDGSTSSSYVIE